MTNFLSNQDVNNSERSYTNLEKCFVLSFSSYSCLPGFVPHTATTAHRVPTVLTMKYCVVWDLNDHCVGK